MNLPNALTVTRIFLVPLLVVVLLTKFEGHLIFGVPRQLAEVATSDFGRHVAALGEMLKRTKDVASQYAQQASQQARQGFQQASEQAREAYGTAERMVRQRPAESLATVFGAGLIAGVVIGLMLHHRD